VIRWRMPQSLTPSPTQGKPKKLLEEVRDLMRLRHYSIRTERCYCDWITRFIRYHGKRHPREMAEAEVIAFLTHLAHEGNVAASTQNQALSVLLFLYKEVLKEEIGWLEGVEQTGHRSEEPAGLSQTRGCDGARPSKAPVSLETPARPRPSSSVSVCFRGTRTKREDSRLTRFEPEVLSRLSAPPHEKWQRNQDVRKQRPSKGADRAPLGG